MSSVSKIKKSTVKRNETLFLITLLAFPVIQFAIFYFCVNFNSFVLAFKKYENNGYVYAGFENFKKVVDDIFVTKDLSIAIKNSTIQFLVTFASMPFHIMVAYCVFKKVPLSGFFKIMLFLPQIISSMVFVICAEYLFKNGLVTIFPSFDGTKILNQYSNSSFWSVLFFGVWMGFAGGLVIYLSSMSSISIDVIESGKLENMNNFQEFWYIVIPLIFPTITTYIVVAFAGFFTNYGYFFSFFGGNASAYTLYDTLGYIFFVKIIGNGRTSVNLLVNYSYAAAGGLLFTAICAPVTIIVKKLLEKFGPSEE